MEELLRAWLAAYKDFIEIEKIFVKCRELEVEVRTRELAHQVKVFEWNQNIYKEHKEQKDKGFE